MPALVPAEGRQHHEARRPARTGRGTALRGRRLALELDLRLDLRPSLRLKLRSWRRPGYRSLGLVICIIKDGAHADCWRRYLGLGLVHVGRGCAVGGGAVGLGSGGRGGLRLDFRCWRRPRYRSLSLVIYVVKDGAHAGGWRHHLGAVGLGPGGRGGRGGGFLRLLRRPGNRQRGRATLSAALELRKAAKRWHQPGEGRAGTRAQQRRRRGRRLL